MKKVTFCHMKCWDMKRILALPACQKICSDKEPDQIDFGKFDLGHPVIPGSSEKKRKLDFETLILIFN